jgi:hypothetical protein
MTSPEPDITTTETRPAARSAWMEAVAVLGLIATVMLAARALRPVAEAATYRVRTGDMFITVPAAVWPRVAIWVAIAVVLLLRWRVVAAIGAWAAVAFEIVVAVGRSNRPPGYAEALDLIVWPVLLAATAALLLTVTVRGRAGSALLGRRGLWLLGIAAAVAALSAVAVPLLADYHGPPSPNSVDPGFYAIFSISTQLTYNIAIATGVLVLVPLLASVLGVDRPVRRRVLTILLAATAGYVVFQLGLPLPFGVSTYLALSRPVQAALMVVVPGLVLGLGLWLIHRGEPAANGANRTPA